MTDAPAQAGFAGRWFHAQDDLRLHYRDYGDPRSARTPVLCLPGLTRNARDFHEIASRLARERRVLCPDYRGRGMSAYDPDPRRYVPATYVGDLHHLLTLADVEQVVVIGTSMGGLLAIGLAVFFPTLIAGAVLNDIGPDVEGDGLGRIIDYIARDAPQPDWPAAMAHVRHMSSHLKFQTEAQWQRLAYGGFRRRDDGLLHVDWDVRLAEALRQDVRAMPDLWAMYRALRRVPLLTLRGAQSDVLPVATFDRMGREHPDCRQATIPGVGHAPMLDEPQATEALDEFFIRC